MKKVFQILLLLAILVYTLARQKLSPRRIHGKQTSTTRFNEDLYTVYSIMYKYLQL